MAKETDWGVLCTEEWADPCEMEMVRKPSKLIPVNNKGNNSKDSVLDSITGSLPVYKAIGVGNHHL